MNESKLIYPEMSYRIIGIAFKIFNEVGFGWSEKYYQRMFAKSLDEDSIAYQKEKSVVTLYHGSPLGHYILDFIVDNKIVVEFKVRPRFGYIHIKQVSSYLKATGYKLALLIYFTKDGVKYRRIVNLYS